MFETKGSICQRVCRNLWPAALYEHPCLWFGFPFWNHFGQHFSQQPMSFHKEGKWVQKIMFFCPKTCVAPKSRSMGYQKNLTLVVPWRSKHVKTVLGACLSVAQEYRSNRDPKLGLMCFNPKDDEASSPTTGWTVRWRVDWKTWQSFLVMQAQGAGDNHFLGSCCHAP